MEEDDDDLQDVLLFSFNKSGGCYCYKLPLPALLLFFSSSVNIKVKQSRYRSVHSQKVPGV
jgi:hypothetical protein